MSRASNKRKQKTLQRRATPPSTGNTNGNMPSYSTSAQALVAQLQAKMGRGYNDVLFSPGLPLSTIPGVDPAGIPRQWSFPIAYNTSGVDRSLGKPDVPSFQQLRSLAKMYSGITLPERVWLDMIPGLRLDITLRPDLKAAGLNDSDPDIAKAITKYKTFFDKPDKQRDLHSWIRMAIRSQTQIDELYIYKRLTRGGQLYALELVDGATVKPLLDDWGRIPESPLGAFQQFPWGIPGELFTTGEMIHYQESPADDSPFGFSRVERFIMEVNQALRKKKRDLAMFTEGNIPSGLMEVPESSNWTPDQIDNYEQMWNALLAGNVQQQVRVKFTQPGMKYIKTDTGEILTDFDLFLYKIAFGIYGVPLTYAGFVEDVHKSSDEGQQNVIYNRTLKPTVVIYGYTLTQVLRNDFHDDRFIVSFAGYEEVEDISTQANAYKTFASFGAITPASVARIMKFPDDIPETGPFVPGQGGNPIFLDDYARNSPLRKAQTQSQLVGLQFATSNPGGVQPGKQNEEEVNQDDDSTQQGKTDKESEKSSQLDKKGQPGSPDSGQKDKNTSQEDKANTKSDGHAKEKPSDKNGAISRAAEGTEQHTGMMIAFMLDPAAAEQIALPDGDDPSDLHVTLAYLGDSRDEPPQDKLHPLRTSENLASVLSAFVGASSPLQGLVGGVGRFAPSDSSDGMSPVIALVNVPGLQEWRRRLVDVLDSAGYWVANNFDYTPHITLKYINANAPMPVDSIENTSLQFNELCLCTGDNRQYFSIGETNARTEYGQNGKSGTQISEQARRAELKRWRACAMSDIERRRGLRTFESNILSLRERSNIQVALERCQSVERIKEIFRVAQSDPDFNWQDTDPEVQKAMASMRNKGVKSQKWKCKPGACDTCTDNADKVVPLGQRFPTGVYTVPGHNNCECETEEMYE